MKKAERLRTDEVYVCGFVPSYSLPNKTSCSLDPFLSPLMLEIENAFINGINIMQIYIYIYLAIYMHVQP